MTEPFTAAVHSVHRGPGGVPNLTVNSILVTSTHVMDDAYDDTRHHGPGASPDQAVCLYALEVYDQLRSEGLEVGPASFAENITTVGLPLDDLPSGTVLGIGDDLVIEVTAVRIPCSTLRPLDARLPRIIRGRSGKYARIIRGGTVSAGDPIRVAQSTGFSGVVRGAVAERNA